MSDSGVPFSGPYASYLTTISILNLQLMISTQFTSQECLDWEKSLQLDLLESRTSLSTDPIVERLRESPVFILNELRISSITSALINFTSTTEHYMKEILELCLRRNDSLRRKSFSGFNISALELEEFDTITDLKKKLFKSISSEHFKGRLFSQKFNRASLFLDIKNEDISGLLKSMDSFWLLRNKLAHSNKGFLEEFRIFTKKGEATLSKEPSKMEFLAFAIDFLSVIDNFTNFLRGWDTKVMDKWPPNAFIS